MCALVALALGASALPAIVLHAAAGLPALDADAEWPVPVVWACCLIAAVLAAEGTHRLTARWLAG